MNRPDRRSVFDLKVAGAGVPAPENIAALYRSAFVKFGPQMLWSRKPVAQPTVAQALVIAEALRTEGNMQSRPLAVQIEIACRAVI